MTTHEKAEAIGAVDAVEPKPADPKEHKVALVDSVRGTKTAYADAGARVKALRAELAEAIKQEAQALNALGDARVALKKEAEGDE